MPTIVNSGKVDFFEVCQRAGKVLLLAPSSYLGNIYSPLIIAELTKRLPELEVIAADDLLFARNTAVNGFVNIIPTNQLKDGSYQGIPVVNCAYSLPTWLALKRISDEAKCQCFDLPELLYLLGIPLVYQQGVVTREQTLAHLDDFKRLQERFADDLSRKTLDAIIRMRMDGDRAALLNIICPGEQEYFSLFWCSEHPIRLTADEHYVDIGAYDGDTVKKFLAASRGEYASIHAFEPDPENFKSMVDALGDEPGRRISLHRRAVSDIDGFLTFAAKGTMGSRAEKGGNIQVQSIRLDDVLNEITLLKMDVEGHEPAVLRGGGRLIAKCRPRLAITCYHHALDLLDIVAAIDEIRPGACLRLRHYSMYFYDTILYVEWPDAGE